MGKHSKRRRHDRRSRAAHDPVEEFIAELSYLLESDDPVDAEAFASSVVATWRIDSPKGEVDAEDATNFLEAFGSTMRPQALALLLGLGAVAPEPYAARARRAAQGLIALQVSPPAWSSNVGQARVTQSWILHEVLGDGEEVILACRYPDGHEHTLFVYVDTNMGRIVTDAFVGPTIAEALAGMSVQLSGHSMTLDEISPADAAARVRVALELTDMTLPTIETETFPAVRALLDARLAAMPLGGIAPQQPEWSEAARDALVEEFLASPEAHAVAEYEDREEIAHHLVRHGCDYDGSGDPLRWSLVVVEVVFWDWWPRKIHAEPEFHAQVPAVMKAWARFAGRKKELREDLIAETVASIDDLSAEFLDVVSSPPQD